MNPMKPATRNITNTAMKIGRMVGESISGTVSVVIGIFTASVVVDCFVSEEVSI